jgi:phospholipid transport system substrate-binding protein
MSKRSLLALFALMLAGLFAPAAAAPAPQGKAVVEFVERVLAASTALLTVAWDSEEKARQDCRKLLDWAFDLPGMARYALGDAWAKASERDRTAFRQSFETLIVNHYVRQMRTDPKRTFAYLGYKQETEDRVLAVVRTIVPERPDQIWWWRLRAAPDGSLRVIDLIVEGRSVLLSEREEYARILQANDGRVGAVVEFVKNRAGR